MTLHYNNHCLIIKVGTGICNFSLNLLNLLANSYIGKKNWSTALNKLQKHNKIVVLNLN